jgi:hypothetical protein
MTLHTTNYFNTFIRIAEDCKNLKATIPPRSDKPKIAQLQFDMLIKNPYKFTSDEVLFHVFATRNELLPSELENAKSAFFSKGQPCLRASPLTKTYGWGIHFDAEGKIALYSTESQEYEALSVNENLQCLKAMRSKK